MKKYSHLLTASILLVSLTACSQQQVAGGSQQVQNAPPIVTTKDKAHCRGCNAPKIEPIIKPATTPKPVAVVRRPKPAPAPRRATYKPRQYVPTVPNKKNASSALVKRIQTALSAKGYNTGSTDGVMGTRTSSALSAFQKTNNLPAGINRPTLNALGIK